MGSCRIAGNQWQEIGHANNVVAMAATPNKLFCATKDDKLWVQAA
ncbi:hypothetical protein [Archangium violaceum]|nr:hypothetical protein [Archangium violaceum]